MCTLAYYVVVLKPATMPELVVVGVGKSQRASLSGRCLLACPSHVTASLPLLDRCAERNIRNQPRVSLCSSHAAHWESLGLTLQGALA